jgi:DNA mismatch endonuclease (patch repair protein)
MAIPIEGPIVQIMDVFTKQKRSEVMARIRAKNTKPEIAVRKLLHRMGYRFRVHNKNLPGKPDVCLAKHNTIILVHGCFWHNHKRCNNGKIPKSNMGYWLPKIRGNVERDKKHRRALRRLGWKVITIWECELCDMSQLEKKIKAKIG